ncbi:hypothetical protein OAA55_00775 [bacterium]|nr:hypothetical protein [bacterium]
MFASTQAEAQQRCSPSDPLGDNTNNLCPVHYHGVYGNSFTRKGIGDSSFYGPALGPNTPGKKIVKNRLDNEYFTGIETGGKQGGITIRTSSGVSYTINKENKVTD